MSAVDGGGVSGLDFRTFIGSTGMSTVAERFFCFHDNRPLPLRLSPSEWYCVVEEKEGDMKLLRS